MKALHKSYINNDTVLLLLRIILGVVFLAHGSQKVLGIFGGYGLSATAGYFEQTLHIPAALAYVASFTEFLGGIFILAGFLTKVFSLGLVINMLVAILAVHIGNGFFNPAGFEYPLTLLVIALILLLAGAGNYSLDKNVFGKD